MPRDKFGRRIIVTDDYDALPELYGRNAYLNEADEADELENEFGVPMRLVESDEKNEERLIEARTQTMSSPVRTFKLAEAELEKYKRMLPKTK